MTPLPAVPNVVEVALGWIIDEDATASTKLHFHTPQAAPTAADLTTLAADVGNAMNGNVATAYSSHVKLGTVTATELASGNQLQGSHAYNSAGARTGGFLPANVCALALYKIGRRYRGGKPRSYFPFGTQTDLNDAQTWLGASTGAWATQTQTFITNLLVAHGGLTLDYQVALSFYAGHTWAQDPGTGNWKRHATRRAAPVVDRVLSISYAPKIASQRRRMVR